MGGRTVSRPYEEEVSNGINLLTRKLGRGFQVRINHELFHVRSCHDCPLGQLYGRFIDGVKALRLTEEEIVAHGFRIKEPDVNANSSVLFWVRENEEYQLLNKEWMRQLWEL